MIKVVAVGKCKEKSLVACIDEYLKRLKVYTKLDIIEVEELAALQSNSDAQNEEVKTKEGKNLLAKIKSDEYVIVLDLHGQSINSEKFAQKIDEITTYKTPNITFVIGGSLGISKEIIERADFRWKLSDCTFTHQMCRFILIEQIYRAYKILRNEPYHK